MEIHQHKCQRIGEELITFFVDDANGVLFSCDDSMIVFLAISIYDVKRILMDNESSADILFYGAFSLMGLPKDCLCRVNTSLISFSREVIPIEGIVTLLVIIGQALK